MFMQVFHKGLQNGKIRLALALVLALALLVPLTATASAQQLKPSGESCVEGLVIDWQENPIEEGWVVEATPIDADGNPTGEPQILLPSEEDDEVGQFSVDNDPHLISTKWRFEIKLLTDPAAPAPNGEKGESAPAVVAADAVAQAADVEYLVGDWRGVTPTSFDVTLDTASGKCTRVRFKLREIVTVLVTKINADHALLADWTIIATPDKKNIFAEQQDGDTNVSGEVIFELTPGKWIFTEESPADVGSDFYPIIPVTGQQELEIKSARDRADDDNPNNNYDPGLVDYVLRFKNEVGTVGCIEVIKKDFAPEGAEFDVDFPLAGWEISVLRADGSEQAFGYTDATGTVSFKNLPFGPYTLTDEDRAGWELVTDPVEDEIHGDYTQALANAVNVSLTDSTCVKVRFVNKQAPIKFYIEGRKIDANGHYGLPGWKIEATPQNKGGYELDPVFTDGSGYYRFELPSNDYTIPGSKYKVCEDDDVDGWVAHGATCYTVTVPKTPGATVSVPDFVNQQVGHSDGGSTSGGGWSGGGMSGGWSGGGMSGGMGGMEKPGGMDAMKCSKYHEVMKGEGLYDIGAMHMKPAGAMLAANPWIQSRPNHYLYLGDKVCIP